eukprot:RCo032814
MATAEEEPMRGLWDPHAGPSWVPPELRQRMQQQQQPEVHPAEPEASINTIELLLSGEHGGRAAAAAQHRQGGSREGLAAKGIIAGVVEVQFTRDYDELQGLPMKCGQRLQLPCRMAFLLEKAGVVQILLKGSSMAWRGMDGPGAAEAPPGSARDVVTPPPGVSDSDGGSTPPHNHSVEATAPRNITPPPSTTPPLRRTRPRSGSAVVRSTAEAARGEYGGMELQGRRCSAAEASTAKAAWPAPRSSAAEAEGGGGAEACLAAAESKEASGGPRRRRLSSAAPARPGDRASTLPITPPATSTAPRHPSVGPSKGADRRGSVGATETLRRKRRPSTAAAAPGSGPGPSVIEDPHKQREKVPGESTPPSGRSPLTPQHPTPTPATPTALDNDTPPRSPSSVPAAPVKPTDAVARPSAAFTSPATATPAAATVATAAGAVAAVPGVGGTAGVVRSRKSVDWRLNASPVVVAGPRRPSISEMLALPVPVAQAKPEITAGDQPR